MVEGEYDIAEEIEKFKWADIIVFHTPIYWMYLPWGFKKYIDEVYMSAYKVLFDDDGRDTGGMMDGVKYMLVTTSNAPEVKAKSQHRVAIR